MGSLPHMSRACTLLPTDQKGVLPCCVGSHGPVLVPTAWSPHEEDQQAHFFTPQPFILGTTQCHTTEVSEVTEFSSRISHEHVGHNGLQNYYSSRGPALSICLKLSVISIFLCDKFFGLFCFAIGSQTRSKLTLKSQSSLLDLLSAGIIMGMYHHTWLLLINFQI